MKIGNNTQKIFYILLSFSIVGSAQTLTLTLEESLELGLRNSKEITISRSQIDKAEAVVEEYSSAMLPKISLNANYSRMSEVPPFEVNLPIFPEPVTIQESYLNNYIFSASVEQPLFTGFRLSSLKSAAEYNKSAEEFEDASTRLEKIKNIESSFWRFYISKQIVLLVKQNLNVLKDNLHNTESLLKNGLATKNDLLKLKVEVGNVELALVDARNNLMIARASFNKTIGLEFVSDTDIKIDNIRIEEMRDDLSTALSEAEGHRHELKSAKLRLNALDEMKTASHGDWYPQLFAFGNFYYNNPNQRFLPLEDKFNDSWDIGVALKWKVWDWGGRSAKTEQIKQDYLITENNLKLLMENIHLEVYNNYLELKKSLKKIDLSELQVQSAEENYRITEQKYYQQLVNSTELIDAEASLLNAKISLITSKVEYRIGLSKYKRSLGRNLEYKMNSIEVKNLTKKFGKFTSVDNISFNVSKGEIFGFLGANGAGKSTTIRMLCGILKPTQGDATVGGFSVMKEPDQVKINIGYMSQKFSLYDDLTVEENIDFFGGVYGLSGDSLRTRKNWVLNIANLQGKETLLTGSLPGGIKQRLALGTSVIHNPKILFLDEPTSGVDPISRRSFWELINELSDQGTTVFVTTHYLEEAEFCNNIILINAGKLIAEGEPKDLKTNYLKNDIIEIECEQPVPAMELLEKSDFVEDTSIFGNNIHITVNAKYRTPDQVKIILSRNNITASRIEKIVPTLEDVFINLLDSETNV